MSHFYQIKTSQSCTHSSIVNLVRKHLRHPFLRPFSIHQLQAFRFIDDWVRAQNKPVILDSGCGTGLSTLRLAEQFPSHAVVGIDKSLHRLKKSSSAAQLEKPKNCAFIRCNLEDIWRLILASKWPITHHFILYPNPWPKSEHLKRRWHGHPVFPSLIWLSPYLEIRSNWKAYLEEFSIAVFAATDIQRFPEQFSTNRPISLFEKKYIESQCPLFRLIFSDLTSARHKGFQCFLDSAH